MLRKERDKYLNIAAGQMSRKCLSGQPLFCFLRITDTSEEISTDQEFMFPEKHIRYIAVAENEDTEKGLSDFVPFKNLFNEWYAKDTSRKVKAALKAKLLAGENVFAHASLGYKRDPDNHNGIVIDEETRWIVEKIFDLAAHGAGAARIVRILMSEGIPTPGYINYTRYGTFSHIYEGHEEKAGV